MNWRVILILFIVFIIGGFIYFTLYRDKQGPEKIINTEVKKGTMKLTSSAFTDNQNIPPKYTCDGENVNPPLSISDVPDNAKSLVLIMDDPDAPAGTWVHWTLWNIDQKTKEIAENSLSPGAVEGQTSFGKPGYGGPCPPSGTHRYFFKLYALDITLSISNSSTKQDLENAMAGHVIQKVELIGLYSRK